MTAAAYRADGGPVARERLLRGRLRPAPQRGGRGLRRRGQDLDAGLAHPARAARRRAAARDPRDHLHAQGRRRDARAAERLAAPSSAPRASDAERVARAASSAAWRRPSRARSRRAGRRCTSACWRAAAPVEVRTFHAWFSQLLRAAPLELLDELGLQPDMELIEDPADHRGRGLPPLPRRGAGRRRRCAPTMRALVARRGRAQRAAVAGGGARTSGSRSNWPMRRARWRPACRRPLAGWLAIRRQALPSAGAGAPLRALASALGLGARHSAGRRDRARRRRCAADDAQARSTALWHALFTEKGTPRKHRARSPTLMRGASELAAHRRRRSTSTMRTSSTCAWCGWRACCWPSTRATSASAAWPTWPTWSAARSRCCATRRWPAGCRSGSTRACATC